jgi:hypothetical protein
VKAHSNNKFNEKADRLAKVTGENEITINWAEFNKLKFNIWWKDTNLTDELRRWTKELNLLRWKAEVILSSKFEYRWIKHNLVDWEWSSKLLKNDMRETDEVDSQVRSFIIKNYLENLPTLERLNERYGKLYTSDKCMRCDRMIENWQHIWICEKNDTTLRKLVEEAAIKIWKKERKEVTTSEKIELENALKEGLLSNRNQGNELNVIMILKGLVPKELSNKKIIKKYKNEVIEVLNELVVNAYDRIWKARCKEVNEKEKQQGITREMKTEKKREYQTNTEKQMVNKKESDRKKELIVQRWMGCSLETKIGASKVWQLNRVDDILNSEILE